ncbi:polypeptide N-acetylgalactosaminyltransferase 13-like [Physella acuta]|uniref:polypeptide N-acetylgalactosaminyltransferase 13-like n=1 Tax=Physella acuta TaxID=109671 RepID=UPI0027DB7E7B|nr:polypeptide N-acetylgalactosaminyltransferase 13-like [Physella acuta]
MNIFKTMQRKARKKSSCVIFAIVSINIIIVFLLQTNSSLRRTFENTFRYHLSLHSALDVHQPAGKYRTDQRTSISVDEFRAGGKTGNPLIDGYGRNNLSAPGEMGLAVRPREDEKDEVDKVMAEFHINTLVSDRIPLNRMVPDSRLKGCEDLVYRTEDLPSASVIIPFCINEQVCEDLVYRTEDLPSASVIIPFYDEWPSVLIRTIYSVINRSPRRNLQEILLVDDASTLKELKAPLDHYILREFPHGLVRIKRLQQRRGLTQARLVGSREAIGDVLIFFDSHMEVNIDWLPPLLTEISQDRRVVAMATLDYIQSDTFMYKFNVNYLTRYGWSWNLLFFETFFRRDQVSPDVLGHRK